MEHDKILLINTGGTLDSEMYPDPDHPPEFARMRYPSGIPGALERLGLGGLIEYSETDRRDSKDIDRTALEDMVRLIINSGVKQVIVLHGTDSMVFNALIIKELLAGEQKLRLVFTGGMLPLANGKASDGWDNIRFAVEKMPLAPMGISIAFHGRFFDPDKTEKSHEKRCFVEK